MVGTFQSYLFVKNNVIVFNSVFSCHISFINPVISPNKIGPYLLKEAIGSGSFSSVRVAIHIQTKTEYACKIIPKKRLENMVDKSRFEQEIRIHQRIHHPNIVQLIDVFKDSLNYYIILELCTQGELFSSILCHRKLREDEASQYFNQVLLAVAYIHNLGIAHRDLKPENILISDNRLIKLCDFGLSKLFERNERTTSTSCGSPCYASPEVISGGSYDAFLSDIWSLGVILYSMVTGQLPWTKRNRLQLFHQIQKGKYVIPAYVSPLCSSLITSLIKVNPSKRITLQAALKHPFITMNIQNESIDWKDCRYLSLRKMDQFFEREYSLGSVFSIHEYIKNSNDCIKIPKMRIRKRFVSQVFEDSPESNDYKFKIDRIDPILVQSRKQRRIPKIFKPNKL